MVLARECEKRKQGSRVIFDNSRNIFRIVKAHHTVPCSELAVKRSGGGTLLIDCQCSCKTVHLISNKILEAIMN